MVAERSEAHREVRKQDAASAPFGGLRSAEPTLRCLSYNRGCKNQPSGRTFRTGKVERHGVRHAAEKAVTNSSSSPGTSYVDAATVMGKPPRFWHRACIIVGRPEKRRTRNRTAFPPRPKVRRMILPGSATQGPSPVGLGSSSGTVFPLILLVPFPPIPLRILSPIPSLASPFPNERRLFSTLWTNIKELFVTYYATYHHISRHCAGAMTAGPSLISFASRQRLISLEGRFSPDIVLQRNV